MICCRPKTFYLFDRATDFRKIFNIEFVKKTVISKLNIPKMDESKIPSPYMTPEEIAKIPLPPQPYPSFLTSYLSKKNHKRRNSMSNVYSPHVSVEENNQFPSSSLIQRNEHCYEVQQKKTSFENSRKCYELAAEGNLFGGSKLNYSNILLDNIKKETTNDHSRDQYKSEESLPILKSKENFIHNCLKPAETQEVQNKQRDSGEEFDSSVFKLTEGIKMNPISTPQSLKRSHSMCDDASSTVDYKFTPKRARDGCSTLSLSQNSPFSFNARKSLPAKSAFLLPFLEKSPSTTSPDNSVRRKSFPLIKLSRQSPLHSGYRSCVTDQTPYAEGDSIQRRKRIRTILPYYNSYDLMSLESEYGFIDSHCHLDFLFQRQGYSGTFTDFQKKNEDTFPKSYQGCLAVFCNPFTFNQEFMWSRILKEKNVWASFGCHPHNAKDYNDDIEKSLCAALKHSKVRALGEIGLDYSNRNNCLKEKQFAAFRRQLKIAVKEQLPVVIHCREAHEDGMSIIKEILPTDYTIHLHCFTDTWEWAQKWLQEFPNLFIGITNVVTFPSAESVHEVAKNIPLSRLLLETDAPYFVPRKVNKETRFSHPGMAIHVAAQIAALKGILVEEVLKNTRKNTKRMYNI